MIKLDSPEEIQIWGAEMLWSRPVPRDLLLAVADDEERVVFLSDTTKQVFAPMTAVQMSFCETSRRPVTFVRGSRSGCHHVRMDSRAAGLVCVLGSVPQLDYEPISKTFSSTSHPPRRAPPPKFSWVRSNAGRDVASASNRIPANQESKTTLNVVSNPSSISVL